MSSLTQARLVPLSYRYWSMTSRRLEMRGTKIQQLYARHNHFQAEMQATQQGGHLEHRHISSSDQRLGRLFAAGQPSPVSSSSLSSSSFKRMNEYLSATGDNLLQTPSCRRVTRRQLGRQNYKDDHRGQDDSHHCSDTDGKPSKLYLAALGILGLFGKSSTSDIDEEPGNLSDEQKMKKMKPIELKIAKGVLAMCDQDYTKADELFHEALRMAQDERDEKQEEMILNLIAANFFESGDLEHAEKLFIDIMKRMISNGVAPTSPAILELSLKLASIYSKTIETHEKALKGFKFVINTLMQSLDDILTDLETLDVQDLSEERRGELALLGWSYDWFAKHLLTVDDYGFAVNMLQRALQISSKILGPLHDQTLILLNDVGTTLAMDEAPGEGKTFIEKAVEGAITSQSKELASFYVNLGLVNLKLLQLQEAKRFCEYSMELAKKNKGHHNSHEVIELSRNCLSEVERRLLEKDKK